MGLDVPSFQKAPGLAHEIARYLRSAIADGKFKPGEKLPAEQTLATSFGVSRSVIREAVSQLRYEGLIKSYQGLGVFVSETGSPSSFVIDSAALAESGALAQIFELRMTLEADAAALAAKRRTKKHLDAMKGALAEMALAIERGEDGVAPDIAFHRVIAEATGNTYFAALVRILNDNIRTSIFVARLNTAREGRYIADLVQAEHAAIYQAILNRDPVKAREASRTHLEHTAKQLKLVLD
ncbi:FadR/GntR family transcriptional regulator [Microvirga sp. VF16]|uniref:FadR/GntR family transcriptional regulator n=1 Tax=Microvirga sp. VF16 TaxID=2807101 RepID=UPI00193D31B7|nr:FadR/GntR family transcriptional regulator [Microvirga sp. VF16]QRM33067.1 FadR family transcriptional regulator [Microvirga sp. VF16]